jgi:epoxide hydrolase 4
MPEVEHLFYKTNGIWMHTAAAGPKDGPLLVFLHGFPEFWYGWKEQIPYFAGLGFRVLAPDQRGYNLSDKPRGLDAYRLDVLADDIAGLIEVAGYEKAVVVGHDWGGIVAWWLAKHCPERVERLVVLNAPHWSAMMEDVRSNPRQVLRSAYAGWFQTPILPEVSFQLADGFFLAQGLQFSSRPGIFTGADLRQYRRAWMQPGALTSMLNWYRALLRRSPRWPQNPYIGVETLILWGCRDHFLGTELARMSQAMCSQARLVLFRGATHWLQHEEPDQVNRMISSFISGG